MPRRRSGLKRGDREGAVDANFAMDVSDAEGTKGTQDDKRDSILQSRKGCKPSLCQAWTDETYASGVWVGLSDVEGPMDRPAVTAVVQTKGPT